MRDGGWGPRQEGAGPHLPGVVLRKTSALAERIEKVTTRKELHDDENFPVGTVVFHEAQDVGMAQRCVSRNFPFHIVKHCLAGSSNSGQRRRIGEVDDFARKLRRHGRYQKALVELTGMPDMRSPAVWSRKNIHRQQQRSGGFF